MLDSMSTEQADAVMAALPPNVAERVVEDVENAEVRARAAARAVVHLESSALRGAGATACVAGERATLVLDSANPGGGKLSRGGAVVRCVLYPLEAIKDSSSKNNASGESNIQYARIRGASVEAEVTDAGTGSYEISYRLVRAGAGSTRTGPRRLARRGQIAPGLRVPDRGTVPSLRSRSGGSRTCTTLSR